MAAARLRVVWAEHGLALSWRGRDPAGPRPADTPGGLHNERGRSPDWPKAWPVRATEPAFRRRKEFAADGGGRYCGARRGPGP